MFDDLARLRSLYVDGNNFTALPKHAIADLSTLQIFDISRNGLTALPDDPFDGLTDLYYLNFRKNSLASLDANAFGGPASLETLLLDNNELTEIPDGLFERLPILKSMHLRNNPGADFAINVELEQRTTNTVGINVAQGSPFPMRISLAANGGSLSREMIELDGGAITSEDVTVSPDDGVQGNVVVSIVSAEFYTPSDRRRAIRQSGIQIAAGESLTIIDVPASDGQTSVQSDETAPTISSVAITSNSGTDSTYGIGDQTEVTVTFSAVVNVTGAPQLELDIGGTNKNANYSSVSGSAAKFVYAVEVNDSDSDGIFIGPNKLSLNGARYTTGHQTQPFWRTVQCSLTPRTKWTARSRPSPRL